MTVRQIFVDGSIIEVTGAGYRPVGEFKASDSFDPQTNKTFRLLLQAGLLCSDAVLEEKERRWLIKGDPTEGALVVVAAKAGINQAEIRLEAPSL